MRYWQIWLEIAQQQLDALPDDLQHQIAQRVEQLLERPELPATTYNPRTDQWITTYGDGAGLLVLAINHQHQAVNRLIADFPELAPGLVSRQLARAHAQLIRLPTGQWLAEAVELLTRQRLLRLLQACQQKPEHPAS